MLTRLRVSGFKNLVDVDVRLGPFTCVAGANGIGKSNLFDAVHFLTLAADRPLAEAARGVRGGAIAGAESLFHRVGDQRRDLMSFAVEMIVPQRALGDLGQQAEATMTFLAYRLDLARRPAGGGGDSVRIVREELHHIPQFEAHRHLHFKHSAGKWRRSVVVGERRAPFISTHEEDGESFIQLHQDGTGLGQPVRYAAARLPRTVLSGSGTAESPTVLIARREMQSWRLLQLEPSALRRGDELTSPRRIAADGSHLAATLHRLTQTNDEVCGEVAERLAKLSDDVRGVRVDRDESRGLLTLRIVDREGTEHPAPAIADGSLRLLALAVLERDPQHRGLICMEEPENGVHPERIPAMLELLHSIAVDVSRPVGADNPLGQVIVNTHSPAVVAQVPEESLLVALARADRHERLGLFHKVELHPLPGTWRAEAPGSLEPVPFDRLLAYLNPIAAKDRPRRERQRVADRDDLQQLFMPFEE